jgi:alpha-galactosidase
VTAAGLLRAAPATLTTDDLRRAPARANVTPEDGDVRVERNWTGGFCRSRVVNRGKTPARVASVTLFDLQHDLPAGTRLYGESFQMLSQTAGTLGEPADLSYNELKHYRIPQPDGVQKALSGMMTLAPPGGPHTMLAFTSCRKFIGRFHLRSGSIEIIVDTENLELAPGEAFELEEFTASQSPNRAELLTALARRIQANHPRLPFAAPPTGWCSWYCFGPRVTAQNVLDNLDVIAKSFPGLKYIQIDDGYQPAMGDWLETGKAFGGDIKSVLKEIRKRGFEPAIWVAPFIAERASHLFEQHPDWFIQSPEGGPLESSRVTFQGWRRGPWFALDGTNPAVRKHFESLFRTMREDWGCTYFKLDANFWGAMHGGRLHDRRATRIEAYRRGMDAILRGAGNSFILGCNHPIWPSFGLIHGSRSSGDVSRRWNTIRKIARENLSRNWQNGALWWNDSDAVVLTGTLPDEEFQFHATAVYASGGMILSGDDLTKIPDGRANMLRKLLPPTGIAARFDDDALTVGFIDHGRRRLACVFNWTESAQSVNVPLAARSRLTDFWTGADLGTHNTAYVIESLPPHAARLIECSPRGLA